MSDTKPSVGLTKKDLTAVKAYLKTPLSQAPEDLLAACNLLRSLNATESDWMAIFTKTMLGKLLRAHLVRNTQAGPWTYTPFYEYSPERVRICQILAEFFQPLPTAFESLRLAVFDAFPLAYEGDDLASNLTEPLSWMLVGMFHRMRIWIPINLDGDYARLAVQCAPRSLVLHFEDEAGILTAEGALELAKLECDELLIYGLRDLSDEAACNLAKMKRLRNGTSIIIKDLASFSDLAAEAFSKCECFLRFENLVNVSSKGALALLQHFHLGLSPRLWEKQQLDKIAVPAMKGLEGEVHFYKSNVSDPVSPEFLRSLSEHRGELFWYGDSKFEDWLADCLQNHDGGLHFPYTWEIGDPAAEALSNHTKGILEFPGLRTISPSAAKSLLRHPNLRTSLDLEAIAGGLS